MVGRGRSLFILCGEVKGQGQCRAERGRSERDGRQPTLKLNFSPAETRRGRRVLWVDLRENFLEVLQPSSFKNTQSLQRSH